MAQGTNYTIGSSAPTQLFLPKNHDCFIYNTSTTVTVYLDSYQGGTVASGMPLPPQSSKTWLAGDYCYAITSGTDVGILNVTDNAGDVVNPAAIASSLLTSGLAAQIAANIAVSGAPPIDAFASIGTFNQAISNTSQSPVLDMRKYQSLFISILKGNLVGCLVTIDWLSDALGTVFIEEDAFYVAKGFITQYSQLAKGPFAQITITSTSGAGTLNAFGSYKALQNSFYQGAGGGPITGGIEHGAGTASFQEWEGTVPVGNTWLWEPGIIAGPSILTLRITSGTVTPILRGTAEISSNMIIVADTGFASVTTKQYNFNMPPAQVELSLAATVADVIFRATIVNARPFG